MLELKTKKKKYALNNSYFKNRFQDDPADPFEVLEYFIKNSELPYENGEIDPDTWFYECFVEYQKRKNVELSQFFTPPKTADRVAELLEEYSNNSDPYVLDACCGYGQLSMACIKRGFLVDGFDLGRDFQEPYAYFVETEFLKSNFADFHIHENKYFNKTYNSIISNPPFEELIEFFNFLNKTLEFDGIAVLLLPLGAWGKDKPKYFIELKGNFELIHRENMTESFARTGAKAEIIVLKKKTQPPKITYESIQERLFG